MRHVFIIIAVFFLVSCSNDQPNEEIISTYSNGQTELKVNYPNPNDTTYFLKTYFYKDGTVKIKGHYKDGKQSGTWLWYHENGNLSDSAYFDNGLYVGTRKHWYEDGTLRKVEILEGKTACEEDSDSISGTFKFFYPNGQLEEVNSMKDGKFHGRTQMYFKNGQPLKDFHEKHGVRHGKYEEWDSAGAYVTGQFENGKQVGIWKWYDEDGELTKKKEY